MLIVLRGQRNSFNTKQRRFFLREPNLFVVFVFQQLNISSKQLWLTQYMGKINVSKQNSYGSRYLGLTLFEAHDVDRITWPTKFVQY